MLSQSVEPERFYRQDILLKSLRSLRRIQSVRPVALIEKSVEEIRLSVQRNAFLAVYLLYRDRAKGEIALYLVNFIKNPEFVEIRRLW